MKNRTISWTILRLSASLFVFFLRSPALGSEVYWTSFGVGNEGSWFVDDFWSNFTRPDADDTAVFDLDNVVPVENQQYIWLNDWTLPQGTVPGGIAEVAALETRYSPAHGGGGWYLIFGDQTGGQGGLITQTIAVKAGGLSLGGLGDIDTPLTGKASAIADYVQVGGDLIGDNAVLAVNGGARLIAGDPNISPAGIAALRVGTAPLSPGVLHISDPGSEVHVRHILAAGTDSQGSITVEDGGRLYVHFLGILGGNGGNEAGSIEVTGQDSVFEMVGQFWMRDGHNQVIISNGAKLITHDFVGVGTASSTSSSGFSNEIIVQGTGAEWIGTTGWVRLGDDNPGTLTVRLGANVALSSLDVGNNDIGELDVWGVSTKATLGPTTIGAHSAGRALVHALATMDVSQLHVGFRSGGQGDLRIYDRATVTSETVWIGNEIGSSGQVRVTDFNTTWTNAGSIFVGYAGVGNVLVGNQGVVSTTTTYLGVDPTGIGSATIRDQGSALNTAGTIFVGNRGIGNLRVENNGMVNSATAFMGSTAGSSGIATVRGVDSKWTVSGTVYVGEAGHGELHVESGGLLTAGVSHIANSVGSTGEGTVTGAGSQWINSSQLIVGDRGEGVLNIESGGLVRNTFSRVGGEVGSVGEATVRGSGSRWQNSDALFVGYLGEGTLSILQQGAVTNTFAHVGSGAGSMGEVTVSGQGGSAWTHSDALVVGVAGQGLVQVLDGGLISSNRGVIGEGAGSDGHVTVAGDNSRWTNVGSLEVGVLGEASLLVQNSGLVSVGTVLRIGDNDVVDVSVAGRVNVGGGAAGDLGSVRIGSGGTLVGNGSIVGDVIVQGGTVSPGLSPGVLDITGNYSQTNGSSLGIDLAALSSFDKLLISNEAMLAGTLQVSLTGGFMPAPGDSFEILHAEQGVVGAFQSVILPTLANGLELRVEYSDLSVFLRAAIQGDYNSDGKVDAADYILWRKTPATFGGTTGYNVWRANFGEIAGSGAAFDASTIPEPPSVYLLALFAMTMFCRATKTRGDACPMG
jgi:T5SS/PEP-CTERM-associated repeat protein